MRPDRLPSDIANWKGAWALSTNYIANDAVENDGSSYICILAHTSAGGSEPGVGGSWETYWELLAAKGDAGTTGQLVGSGAWATATGYDADVDVVENDGSGYVCKATHTSGDEDDEPGVGAVWETYWELLVSKGDTGAKGDTGDQGEFGGDSFEYVFDDTTDEADPGSGKLRYNHATPGDVTELYIDDEEANAVDIQAWLRTLDDSTNSDKGYLKVFKKDDSSKFATFNLTALSEEAGYFKLTVTCVASNSTFSDADEIVITFAATGDEGSGLADVVDDATPQLGGDLDAQGNDIADLGVLNFDDATELTISVAETERLASEVAWTQVDGNCTVTSDEDDPDAGGENSAKMAMAAGAAVGLQAYEDLGAGADLTGSSVIRVWIRVTTDDIAKGDFQLVIDNTAGCASPIQYCDLPAQTVAADWVEVDIPYNPILANMNDVNSFGLYMKVDKTCEILIHELRTIVGSVTRTQSYHKIDTEGGSAAKTVLDTINGLVAGDELFLRAESGDRTVVLRSATGNILLPGGGEYSLDNAAKTAGFIGGANWRLLALEGMITTAKVRVYLSANQLNLVDGVFTKVLLDAETYDPSGAFAAYKFTCKVAGDYLITGLIQYAAAVASKRYGAFLYKNGVRIAFLFKYCGTVETVNFSIGVQDTPHLEVDDYIELYARSESGGDTVDVYGSSDSTYFSIHLLSAD